MVSRYYPEAGEHERHQRNLWFDDQYYFFRLEYKLGRYVFFEFIGSRHGGRGSGIGKRPAGR